MIEPIFFAILFLGFILGDLIGTAVQAHKEKSALSKRELRTVLAALRYWQRDEVPDGEPEDYLDTAEIDALYERLERHGYTEKGGQSRMASKDMRHGSRRCCRRAP